MLRLARKRYPPAPKTMPLRIITYQFEGWPVRRLFASLLIHE